MTKVDCIKVERWTVGLPTDRDDPKPTILLFDFDNRESINLAILPEEAVKIARGILEQYEHPPPPRDRYS
ncbi:hypothetical protein AB7M17_007317 [Bradyrhizobium sp. USDA 377]